MKVRFIPTLTNRWALLALLFLIHINTAIQFQSVPPLTPFLFESMSITYTQIGFLIGLFMLPGIFMSLPGGLLASRFGDKTLMVVGLLLMLLGSLTFASSRSFTLAVVGRIISGVGGTILIVQANKIITDWFVGKEIATAMAIRLSAWPLGIAISLASLGAMAAATSWQTAIYVTSAFTAIILVSVILLFPSSSKQVTTASENQSLPWDFTGRELGLILMAGTVWLFVNTGLIIFLSFAPSLLVEGGTSFVRAGLYISLGSWIFSCSVPLGGYLTDKTRRTNLFILIGSIGPAILISLVPIGKGTLGWIILFGVVAGVSPGAVMSLPGEVLRPESRATGFGLFFTTYYIGMALLPPVAGFLHDLVGSAVAPVWFSGFLWLMISASLLAFRLLQRRWASSYPNMKPTFNK